MNKRFFLTICSTAIVTLLLSSCGGSSKGNSDLAGNPFLQPSSLPFSAPDFSLIQSRHYLPAFEEGIRQQRAEIDSIVAIKDAPTFQNTVLGYENSGLLLDRVSNVFFAISSADNTDEIRALEDKVIPMLTDWSNEIMLNEALFARIKTVYDNEYNTLEGEDQKLLKEIYDGFVRNGANLDAAQKEELKQINTRLAILSKDFENSVTEATNEAGVWVDSLAMLDGLTDAQKEQCRLDAENNGGKAPYYIVITNTTQQPCLSALTNRALREKVYNASIHRSDETSKYNTYGNIAETVKLRARKAALMGYPNYAAYSVSKAMAQTPENIYTFLNSLVDAYLPKIKAETDEIETYARRTMGTDFELKPFDRNFYSAQMKQEHFNFSEDDVRDYFNLDSVLTKGVFYAAEKVYGLTFKQRLDIPVYHPDVKVYTVFDKDGSELALFYTDYFRRPTKRGGAWMSAFQKQSTNRDTKPIIYNVCNFAKPAEGEPCLLSFDEVETLFHEFGHALHGMLSHCKYNTLSGTAVSRDFVEMPSQFNEHFATVPEVFDNYARHRTTGEAMPTVLKQSMLRSLKYHSAYALGENLAATSVDLAWHMIPDSAEVKPEQAAEFEAKVLGDMRLLNEQVPPRYKSSYFRHVFGGGYAAGYYSYLWSEVLAVNCADYFVKNGDLSRQVGDDFRAKVLSKGNTEPLEKIFTDFTGLERPDPAALIRAKGL